MTRRKFHISEALERNQAEVDALMYGGYHQEVSGMSDIKLIKNAVILGDTYPYASISRLQTSDFYRMPKNGELVEFAPRLEIKLRAEPRLENGLATSIDYAPFGLSAGYLDMAENMPKPPRAPALLPTSFDFYKGNISEDPCYMDEYNGIYVVGDLHSDAERGRYTRAAAEMIDAVADTMRTVGHTALFEEYGYNEPS